MSRTIAGRKSELLLVGFSASLLIRPRKLSYGDFTNQSVGLV